MATELEPTKTTEETIECIPIDPHTLARWRLVLGRTAEQCGISCGGDGDAARIERLVGFLFEPGEG